MKKFITLFMFLLLLGCSNDDNSTYQQEQITNGGEIFTSQLVTISNNNVNQDEYNATLGDLSIKALQSGDNEIMFLVPVNYSIGETIFEIPEIELKIRYTISQPVLKATSEETIAPFIQNLDSFEQNLGNEEDSFRKQNALNAINLFEQKLSDASDDEKRELAEFYFINKTLIDDIYEIDYTVALKRGDYSKLDSFEAFNNFKVSVVKALAISGLSYLTFSIPSPDLFSKLLAAGTAVIAIKCWYDSYDLFIECKERNVFTLDFLIGSYPSSLSGNENEIIIYTHGDYREDIVIRNANKINNSYSNSPISVISDFFENLDVLGNIIWKINYVIDKINQFNPFSDIANIPNASLENSSPNNINATDEILNNISYTVNDSNVTIDEISFENGTMRTKLSINDQDVVNGDHLDTTLKFEYEDEFNNIQGNYPIRINKENDEFDVLGNWDIVDINTSQCDSPNMQVAFYGFNLLDDGTFIPECNCSGYDNNSTYTYSNGNLTTVAIYSTSSIYDKITFTGTWNADTQKLVGTSTRIIEEQTPNGTETTTCSRAVSYER